MLDAVRAGELDALSIPAQPLDVLAQQLVAEVSAREWDEESLYALVRRAWPYRALAREQFDAIVRMLSEGFATRRGRQSAYLHRDAVHRQLRARRGARLTAITCGGAIPDNADYQVVLEPSGTFIGTLNEDFAVESLAGDVFQLGNCSYRILRVEAGRVRVEDAKGQPPTMPFWLGEAPARSPELSASVSALCAEIDARLPQVDAATIAAAIEHLREQHQLPEMAARQLVEYLAASKAMLGRLPTQQCVIFERFFDETGDMHLVVHARFGSRINRALGLMLRKRFCRAFNFELQAAATEDAIVLSLGETHSFALDELPRFVNSRSAEAVLLQAVLDAPLFTTRWRWNATIALAIRRARAGKKVPAPLQRMAAEDLLAILFPDQLACAENLSGEREIPDHPLVQQTLYDCLHEAMDVDGLVALLRRMESGEIAVVTRDLPHPSPLALEVISARPYAYLDDAPLEERRTQAVATRRWIDPETAAQFGQLDAGAIAQVRAQAWPAPDSADELHDALMSLGVINEQRDEVLQLAELMQHLSAQSRATRLRAGETRLWAAAEQLPMVLAAYPLAQPQAALSVPEQFRQHAWDQEEAVREVLRGRLQASGPISAASLAARLALPLARIEAALIALESEGFVLRGQFTPGGNELEWCERRLLARIHRYTIKTLRAEIEPVVLGDWMRFLLEWHGVTRLPRPEGVDSLEGVVEQLEGFPIPAAAWESDVLPARLKDYDGAWLDSLCLSGRAYWVRLEPPEALSAGPVRSTPIAQLTRKRRALWQQLCAARTDAVPALSAGARAIIEHLRRFGASFFDELRQGAGLLATQAEAALAELVAAGLVSSDSFAGLRALLLPEERKRKLAARGRRIALFGLEEAGRWSLTYRAEDSVSDTRPNEETLQSVAWLLLRRYGIVFRRILGGEGRWLPPWHTLLRVYRRLEAQGHIRGGRFVAGVSGEQFALPEAIGALRAIRGQPAEDHYVSLSGADPLNLTGSVLPGTRVPALAANRLLLRNGVPVATYVGGTVHYLTSMPAAEQWRVRNLLLRRTPATREASAD